MSLWAIASSASVQNLAGKLLPRGQLLPLKTLLLLAAAVITVLVVALHSSEPVHDPVIAKFNNLA